MSIGKGPSPTIRSRNKVPESINRAKGEYGAINVEMKIIIKLINAWKNNADKWLAPLQEMYHEISNRKDAICKSSP